MNILWHSNSASTPSGYGNQTKLFTSRLKQVGHEVTISAFYGREGSSLRNEDGIIELPRGVDPYGNDIVGAHAQYVGADLVFSLIDPFVLRPDVWRNLPWAAWVPVDSAPVLPQNVMALQAARWVIAMSRFGETQLRAAGFDPLYVPHGVETEIYKPVDKQTAREAFAQFTGHDLGDKFLVMTVAANKGMPSRKNFAGMLETFALFAQKYPDALFYLHTEPEGIWQGEPIRVLAQQFGVADKIILPAQYHMVCGNVSPTMMNSLYNAADVFMLLSRGEGFGIPIVEAQSAGCPVVVTDFSASSELCLTGWQVDSIPYTFVPGTTQHIALPAEAAKALADMRRLWQRDESGALREATRLAALDYDINEVMAAYMLPALDTIHKMMTAGLTDHLHKVAETVSRKHRSRTEQPVGEEAAYA